MPSSILGPPTKRSLDPSRKATPALEHAARIVGMARTEATAVTARRDGHIRSIDGVVAQSVQSARLIIGRSVVQVHPTPPGIQFYPTRDMRV